MITSIMLSRQITSPRHLPTNLTPFLRCACSLLPLFLRVRPFVFNSLQPLLPKTGGWGYLAQLVFDVCAAMLNFCQPFVFMVLQIAFPATPFLSQTSALPPGVYPSRSKFPNQESSRRSSAFSALPAAGGAQRYLLFFGFSEPFKRSDIPTFNPFSARMLVTP